MARSLYLWFVYLAIFGLGAGTPFILTLGYEWVDMFRPGNVAWELFKGMPIAFMIGSAAVGSYLLFDREAPPRLNIITVLTVLFGLWVTLTTLHAAAPAAAWDKWDWAFKSIMFSAFIPFVIRSRIQIEAFLQVYVFSIAANMIPFGLKSTIAGGGYGRHLGLINRNFFLGEQDTLAAACAMTVPLILYFLAHTKIIPRNRFTTLAYWGLVIIAVATIIGTRERAGLLGMFVVAGIEWLRSNRKVLFGGLCAMAGLLVLISVPQSFWDRMSTMVHSGKDQSVEVRLEVWKWTLDYVHQHPNGGGFDAYLLDEIQIPKKKADYPGELKTQYQRAYHSSFFEVLGEHGYIGISLFLGLISFSLLSLRRTAKIAKKREDLRWVFDLARALQTAVLVMVTVGLFVGFAFQPFFYYLFAMTVCLREYVRRVEEGPRQSVAVGTEALALARPQRA